jgi:hypothetical protein
MPRGKGLAGLATGTAWRKSNVSEGTVWDFEKGRRIPTADKLAAISVSFGTG